MTDEKFKELEKKYGYVPECVKLIGDRLPTKEEVEYGKTLLTDIEIGGGEQLSERTGGGEQVPEKDGGGEK